MDRQRGIAVFALVDVNQSQRGDARGQDAFGCVPNIAPMHVFGVDRALETLQHATELQVTGAHRPELLVFIQHQGHAPGHPCTEDHCCDHHRRDTVWNTERDERFVRVQRRQTAGR